MLKKFSGKEWFGINEEAGYEHGDHDFDLWRARNECRGRGGANPTHEWVDGVGCRKKGVKEESQVGINEEDKKTGWIKNEHGVWVYREADGTELNGFEVDQRNNEIQGTHGQMYPPIPRNEEVNHDVDEDPNDPTSKWPGEPKKEKTSLFVGSIIPQKGLHKIMLTDSGHVVLVYQDSFEGASSRWTGHVHSHPDGELINKIKIDPAEIGD